MRPERNTHGEGAGSCQDRHSANSKSDPSQTSARLASNPDLNESGDAGHQRDDRQ